MHTFQALVAEQGCNVGSIVRWKNGGLPRLEIAIVHATQAKMGQLERMVLSNGPA